MDNERDFQKQLVRLQIIVTLYCTIGTVIVALGIFNLESDICKGFMYIVIGVVVVLIGTILVWYILR